VLAASAAALPALLALAGCRSSDLFTGPDPLASRPPLAPDVIALQAVIESEQSMIRLYAAAVSGAGQAAGPARSQQALLAGLLAQHRQHLGREVRHATRAAGPVAQLPRVRFRERNDLYQQINGRVEAMFEKGVIEEVRNAGAMSETASKMIGLREIRELLDGKMSILPCVVAIQQGTRRYAKRQLTWFRRQSNFQPLNLSLLSQNEAVKEISQIAKSFGVAQGND